MYRVQISDVNEIKFLRQRPRPIFLVSDRYCPKTDGLRPHHYRMEQRRRVRLRVFTAFGSRH